MNASGKVLNALIAIGASLIAGCNGEAAPAGKQATPATLDAILFTARGGERIVLAPGEYGDVTLPRKSYGSQVSIDASQARFTGLMIRGVSNLAISGGRVEGPRERVVAVAVDNSHNIALRDMQVSGSRVAIGIARSDGVVVERNRFDGIRSDGINIAASQHVSIVDNVCQNFNPVQAVYDSAGKLVKDGDHPDCIQAWSIAGRPPTADVTVTGNTGKGFMQGIFFSKAGQGGFDRIIVRNNNFELSAFNGIVLAEARDSEVTGNVVRTIPGAKMLNYPFRPVTAWIRIRGERNRVCGNTTDNPRFSDGTGKC